MANSFPGLLPDGRLARPAAAHVQEMIGEHAVSESRVIELARENGVPAGGSRGELLARTGAGGAEWVPAPGTSIRSVTSERGKVRVTLTNGEVTDIPVDARPVWSREAQAKVQGYWEIVSEVEPDSPTMQLSDGTVLPVKWTKPVSRIVPVFPEPPAFNDYDGTVNVAPLTGIIWRVKDGAELTPGEWVRVAPEELPGEVTVEAVAKPGFRLVSRAEFTHSYPDPEQRGVFTSESFRRADQVLDPETTLDSDTALGGVTLPFTYKNDVTDGNRQVVPNVIQFKDRSLYWPPVPDGSRGNSSVVVEGFPENWEVEFELVRYEDVRHGQALTVLVSGYGDQGRSNVSVSLYKHAGSSRVDARAGGGSPQAVLTGEHQPGKYKFMKFRHTVTVETPAGRGSVDLTDHDPQMRGNGALRIIRAVNGNGDQQQTAIRDLKITRLGF